MGTLEDFRPLLALPQAELERRLALLYEEGLLELQERMHPGSTQAPLAPGIHVQGRPTSPPRPGEGESPEELAAHGRQVFEAMLAPVQERLCSEWRSDPSSFATPDGALPRIVHHLTRVSPPDELFVAAACLLWKGGLKVYCTRTEVHA